MCGMMGMMDRRDHHGEEGIFRKVHFELTRRKDNNWGLFCRKGSPVVELIIIWIYI